MNDKKQWTIQVYLDTGVVFQYSVASPEKAREHAAEIVEHGYRHNDGQGEYEHYGVHRIRKVKIAGVVPTSYPDIARGT